MSTSFKLRVWLESHAGKIEDHWENYAEPKDPNMGQAFWLCVYYLVRRNTDAKVWRARIMLSSRRVKDFLFGNRRTAEPDWSDMDYLIRKVDLEHARDSRAIGHTSLKRLQQVSDLLGRGAVEIAGVMTKFENYLYGRESLSSSYRDQIQDDDLFDRVVSVTQQQKLVFCGDSPVDEVLFKPIPLYEKPTVSPDCVELEDLGKRSLVVQWLSQGGRDPKAYSAPQVIRAYHDDLKTGLGLELWLTLVGIRYQHLIVALRKASGWGSPDILKESPWMEYADPELAKLFGFADQKPMPGKSIGVAALAGPRIALCLQDLEQSEMKGCEMESYSLAACKEKIDSKPNQPDLSKLFGAINLREAEPITTWGDDSSGWNKSNW